MSSEGLINVSQAVKHGGSRQVTNHKTGKRVTIVDISDDKLIVEVDQASEVWAYEDCEGQ